MMKQKKSLTKEQYLRRFSRSARWRLGAAEAEEAIADYQELIFQEERDESKLVEELGDPIQAAWLLTDARGYKRWMWAFTILIGCALSLAWWAHTGLPFYWRLRHGLYGLERQFLQAIAPMAAGMVLALLWSRRRGGRSGPLSWRLLTALGAVVLVGGMMLFQVWHCFDIPWTIESPDGSGTMTEGFASAAKWAIDVGILSALAGAAGLILARCFGRRWMALYVLGMTIAVLCIMSQETLLMTDPWLTAAEMASVRGYLFRWAGLTGLAGLIGTGVALC